MKKIKYAALALLVTTGASFGQLFTIGGGYGQLSYDLDGITNSFSSDDLDFDIAYISIGSEIPTAMSPNFYIAPELRIGKSIGDEEVLGADLEINYFISLSLRGQYHIDKFYAYASVDYTFLDAEASIAGFSVSDSDSELGVGVGVGYNIANNMALELNAQFYENTSIVGGSIKWKF